MISHGKDVKVLCANSNRPLAEGICKHLGLPMSNVWGYSMLYNGIYMSLNCALAVVVLVLLRKKAPVLFEVK